MFDVASIFAYSAAFILCVLLIEGLYSRRLSVGPRDGTALMLTWNPIQELRGASVLRQGLFEDFLLSVDQGEVCAISALRSRQSTCSRLSRGWTWT
jgi:hypothetical protein